MFEDREQAGALLGEELARRALPGPIVVLGIPRGGVPVALRVADALDAPLGVVVARKLGAPYQPELAIGAVTADGTLYVNRETAELVGADDAFVERERWEQAEEARGREERFDAARVGPLDGKTVVVVDDGLATGATAIAAVRSVRARGAERVVLAIPVAPPETVELLRSEVDEIVCLDVEPAFFAVGQFYEDFRQVEDDEVRTILSSRAPAEHEPAPRRTGRRPPA